MRLVNFFCAFIVVIIVTDQCEAILRPIIRLRPKIVLGKHDLMDGGDDDSLKIYRSIAKTVISGYLFGALRRPFMGPWGAGGWDGVSPLSVTFAVGGKRPGYSHGSSCESSECDKSPKVEKIKIIEKEKEKPVKHIVISHKILGPPASSMSVTGGHLIPSMLEESAMAALGPEFSSPWSETQTKYSTLDSSGSSSDYGLPEALDTSKRVKIVRVKESTDSSDDDEYTGDDEDDTSRSYRVIKRQVYTYKDKSTDDEPQSSKYGYKPNYPEGEHAMAESTQAHVIRMENSTEEVDISTENPIKSTTSLPNSSTSTPTTTTTTTTSAPTTTRSPKVNQITTETSIKKSKRKSSSSTTISPIPLTTTKTVSSTVKTIKSESTNSSKLIVGSSKRSTVKSPKESVEIVDDPWLDYLNQKEAQESQSTGSKQSTVITGEPIVVNKKKSRKNNRSQLANRKSKKSKSQSNSNSRNGDPINYNWDEQLTNPKINSVKAFGDGWVSRRRYRSKNKSNRRRSSKSRSKKNKNQSKFRVIRLPNLDSTQGLPFNQLIALPSSSSQSRPIVFPATINRSYLDSNPILMPTSMLSKQMFKRRSSLSPYSF